MLAFIIAREAEQASFLPTLKVITTIISNRCFNGCLINIRIDIICCQGFTEGNHLPLVKLSLLLSCRFILISFLVLFS